MSVTARAMILVFICRIPCPPCPLCPQCSSWQRKRIHRVMMPRRMQSGLIDEAAGQQTFAGEDRDVLFPVHRVGDRAVLDRALQPRLPQGSSARCVELSELLIQIAPEHQIAGGWQ